MTTLLTALFLTTALDKYVAAPDPVYAWKVVKTATAPTHRTYVLELTSQSWRTEKEVDKPVWRHWLTITRPNEIKSKHALLFIGGGLNLDPAPEKSPDRSARFAVETGSIVADLGMVPNQPLRFTDSPDAARFEDDLIAYSRVKHFTTKDDTWLVRLAMVKSGVRAMDAIQAWARTEQIGVDKFVVSGGSKRGWTTWLIGAVDPRVAAIMPVVIDALNSEAITRHHFEAMGFFSTALKDYVNHGLFPHKIGTPEYAAVLAIEDPFNYRDRPALRMPKMLINASGDQFFLPDNSRFYYDKLSDEKLLRYVPNAKHNLAGSDAADTMLAFYKSVISGSKRPRLTWRTKPESVTVKSNIKPESVTLWQANNPDARDFRVDTIGNAYKATQLTGNKSFTARVDKPAKGFTAYFIELKFADGLKLSTPITITPDTLPAKWSDAAGKYPLRAN
ncbi:MAG: PhoPQ-activated pathogenicity [Acidobacteria bacterium]|nr:PhoPQ-activated pathogenicity [Acidobacteriota bacterium]